MDISNIKNRFNLVVEGKKEEEEKKDSCFKLAKSEALMVLSHRMLSKQKKI